MTATALAAACAVTLEIDPDAGPRAHIPLGPQAAFSVRYHHSMYDAPFTEDFVIDADGQIHVIRLSSPSAAVREYHGIDEAGEAHEMNRTLGIVNFRVAMKDPQVLIIDERHWSFLEFGAPGDRLVFSSNSNCS